MRHYKTEGLIEGYIQLPINIAAYTMVFMVEGQLALELNITHVATLNSNSGVTEENVYQWLWEKGNELFLDAISFPYGTKITLTSNDVINGNIATPFENLKNEGIKHL
ncbi:hypothetical protein [Lentibacillus sp. Marseille-P4043]|uniref:hypothetical protein n=1 Tax=Lentibacillus sp. Marseille-P4043 TaxID=2040293 RepID=UPI000D0B35C3|nr:hypothetical protein [Lentibacillus sp. Marseille-P4043]